MIRGLFKLILLAIVVIALGVFFLGWDLGRLQPVGAPGEVGTSGTEAARQVGADVGEKAAQAAGATKRAIEDGGLTTKIKAKMALDDSVKARDLDVDSRDGVVTVSGEVRSEAERQRALSLARETAGVTRVIDQLRIRQPSER